MKLKLTTLAMIASSSAMALDMSVVAHRGHWREAGLPQNTVEAIQRAYEIGFKMVETDFVETESGEIICLHDEKALTSMSSIVKSPKTITPADREQINLGEKLKLPRPYRIPLLKDVLAVVPKDCILQAEIKVYGPTYAKQFDDAVKAAGLTEKNIIVSSFQDKSLADFHAKYPKYTTLWLGAGISKSKQGYDVDKIIAKAKEGGFTVICPGCPTAKKIGFKLEDAERIRAAGFDFRLYGVNDEKGLAYAASLGATGFTCNYPLAAYGWASKLEDVCLQPHFRSLIPDDLKGCYSDKVRTIGIVMPASIAKYSDYARCKAWVEYAGYRTKVASRISFGKLASVEDRVADFEEMWMDPEVDMVVCVRGGTGAQDLIDKIDWKKLSTRKDQKVLGFSNITWILNTMLKKGVGCPITGPSLTHFRYLDADSAHWLGKMIGGEEMPTVKLRALKAGAAQEGLACGGHLSILAGMAGRKCLPDISGRIAFIECSTRKVDVIRRELKEISPWLAGAKAVVFANLTYYVPKKATKEERAAICEEVEQIKRDFAAKSPCPVYDKFPYGHVSKSYAVDFTRPLSVSAEGELVFSK